MIRAPHSRQCRMPSFRADISDQLAKSYFSSIPLLPLLMEKTYSLLSLPAKKEPAQRDTGEACPFMRAAGRSRLFQIGGYDLMFTNMYD